MNSATKQKLFNSLPESNAFLESHVRQLEQAGFTDEQLVILITAISEKAQKLNVSFDLIASPVYFVITESMQNIFNILIQKLKET